MSFTSFKNETGNPCGRPDQAQALPMVLVASVGEINYSNKSIIIE
jgi:hypothetical protein